jgi:8-oxo-dGTP pyrophosphatase MutT (NUDIX family)
MSTRIGRQEPAHATVAAAVCYRIMRGRAQFLLVRTSGGSRWTLPKGHVDAGEQGWRAAAREAREEAGVSGIVEPAALTHYLYPTRTARSGEFADALVAAHLVEVTSQDLSFEPGREPTWCSQAAAARLFAEGGREPRHVREQVRVLRLAAAAIRARAKQLQETIWS